MSACHVCGKCPCYDHVRVTVAGPAVAGSAAYPPLEMYELKDEPPRVAVAATVRVRAYDVIANAVEQACAAGVARAHKHTDEPSRDAIADACADAVKNALCDVLDFGDET